MRLFLRGAILVSFASVWFMGCSPRPIPSESGVDPIDPELEPYQVPVGPDVSIEPILRKGFQWEFHPVTEYVLSGKICSIKRYRWGWSGAIVPIDLAVRWGILVDPQYDRTISWSQHRRWYFWRHGPNVGLSKQQISQHSSNNHIIPANENLLRALLRIKRNDLVELSGYLVNITGSKGPSFYHWNTSQSRKDTGDGSCEIFYVMRITHSGSAYQ